MSRNGSGVYSLPSGNPVVTNTTISSTWANSTLSDISSALTGSIAADGQTPITGTLQMSNNLISNLLDPANDQDAATKNYVDTVTSGLGSTYLAKANNLSDVANVSTSRTNLGLGSIATQGASAVAITGGTIGGVTISSLASALPVASGGTNQTTYTDGQLLIGNSTGNTLTKATLTGGTGITITNGSGSITVTSSSYPLTSGTSVSASGTSIDFTSIPSWVKRITVMFSAVSTNGSSYPLIQIGTSGGIQTTSYVSDCSGIASGSGALAGPNTTTGYVVFNAGNASASLSGSVVLTLVDSATGLWVANGVARWTSQGVGYNAGTKTLSGTLDRVRITTVNGTDTFDAGSINILYE